MKTYAIAALALLPGLLCHAAPSEAKQLPGSTPQEFAARIGQLLPGRCHMDGCTWFSLETANLEGTSAKESLYRLTSKWWSSYHPQHERHPERQYEHAETARRKFESAGVSYVFCSKTMPAVIDTADDSGKWSATMLAPQDENAIYGNRDHAGILLRSLSRRRGEGCLRGDEAGQQARISRSTACPKCRWPHE